MTRYLVLAVGMLPLMVFGADQTFSERGKKSYALGVDIGTNFKMQEIEIDAKAFVSGIIDAYKGRDLKMDRKAIEEAQRALQEEMMSKRKAKFDQLKAKNATETKAFLAKNKQTDGVITTDSGLQYKVITKGKGQSPKASDTVEVEYVGTLIDGTEFDSTTKSGKPITVRVSDMIQGWVEVLQLMKPGSKWQVVVPPTLAYGEMGVGPIGPNQALIFEIHLKDVKGEAATAASKKIKS